MKRTLLAALLLAVPLLVPPKAVAQYSTADCTANRGPVRTGKISGLAVDPDNPGGTLIDFDTFVAITYPNADDPTKWPSVIAPSGRLAGEGQIYVIDNVEIGGFSQCETSVGLEFFKNGDVGGAEFGRFGGHIPHADCRPAGAADAIAKAYATYSQEVSTWRTIWDDTDCGITGGEDTGPVRVVGVAFWDDQDGFSTPRLSLSPILAIIPLDGSGGDTPGDGTTPPPPPPPFQIGISSDFDIDPMVIGNAGLDTIPISTSVSASFNSDLHLWVETDAKENEDFHVSITPEMIPAPGAGDGEVTIATGPMTFPRVYRVRLAASANGETFSRTFLVRVLCNPPFILGINQPQSLSAEDGTQVALEVTPGGTGPLYYQWYRGYRGMTRDPVLAATDSKLIFTTRETAYYWVRVSNACGSADSQAALVTTTDSFSGPARRRSGG